jgi:hypothetical protein
VSLVECILLEQMEESESSSSLRDRAEKSDSSKWSRANVQNTSNRDDSVNGKDSLSWAWSLWEAQIDIPKGGKSATKYGLVARASESSIRLHQDNCSLSPF